MFTVLLYLARSYCTCQIIAMTSLSSISEKLRRSKDMLDEINDNVGQLLSTAVREDPLNVYRIRRYIFISFLSMLTSAILFASLHLRYNLALFSSLPICAGVAVAIALGSVLSLKVRCVCLLSVPTLSTKLGQTALLAVVMGVLVGGPLANIIRNTNEASRSFACMSEMAVNQTKIMQQEFKKAYENVADSLLKSFSVWIEIAADVHRIVRPVHEGLESASEFLSNLSRKASEVANLCEENMRDAYHKCVEPIRNAKSECEAKLNWGLAKICDVLDAPLGTCSIVQNAEHVCSVLDDVDIAFERPLVQAMQQLVTLFDAFDIQADFKKIKMAANTNASKSAAQIREGIRGAFEEKYSVINMTLSIVQYVLVAQFLLVPISAYLFMQNALQGSTPRKSKKDKALPQLFSLLVHFLLATSLFTFDIVLFWVERTISYHGSNITIEASGTVDLNVNVKWGSIMGQIFGAFFNGFNFNEAFMVHTSLESCLPRPTEPNGLIDIIPAVILYITVLAFIIFSSHLQKLKSSIITACYPYNSNANRPI